MIRRHSVGAFDKRISIWKREWLDDGMAHSFGDPLFAGKRWAQKHDTSDGERLKAGEYGQELTTRWTVHNDSLTSTITGGFYLTHHDKVYEVTGAKQSATRHNSIEVTTVSRPDAIVPSSSSPLPDTGSNDET